MPSNDAISSKHLDGIYSAGAEKSLKTIQGALAFEYQPHDGGGAGEP